MAIMPTSEPTQPTSELAQGPALGSESEFASIWLEVFDRRPREKNAWAVLI